MFGCKTVRKSAISAVCLASTGICDRADLLEEKVYFVTLMTDAYHSVKDYTCRHQHLEERSSHEHMFCYEFMPVERNSF